MTKIYCVMNCGGSYGDAWEYIEKAFFDEDKANDYKDNQNKWLKAERKRLDTLHASYEDKEDYDEDAYMDVVDSIYYLEEQAPWYVKEIDVE